MSTKSVGDALKKVLADSYALYIKTQNYHWNVEGQEFYSLHKMFEKQYNDLSETIDAIAEHIRSLGFKTPASFEIFVKHTVIKSGDEYSSAESMITELRNDQVLITETLTKAVSIAQKAGDIVVEDFLTQRIAQHRKNMWLLNSSL